MATSDELLKKMYDSNLASQKAALQSDYDAAVADLNAQKAANQQQAQNNIRLTKTEADRSAVNAAEYYEAAGLSSGAKAQARVAQDNQLLADLTAIRAAQQQGDIDIERQRGLLGQQFAAAIREAQANNDMARAQALYEQAKEAEANLLKQQQLEFDRGQAALDQQYEDQLKFAIWLAENTGDYTMYQTLINKGRPVFAPSGAPVVEPPGSTNLWAETKTELEKLYPGGVIADREIWDSLLKAYGPDVLKDFRFVASTGYSGGNGGGGDGQLRWNRKD